MPTLQPVLNSNSQPPNDPAEAGTIRNWNEAPPPLTGSTGAAGRAADLPATGPVPLSGGRPATDPFPIIGTEFVGFHLLATLGTGAFGRVYLASQGDLAERYVALKVSSDLHGESQALARLQHTNIVPVYSVHRSGRFQAVCMPYLGSNTLAHLLKRFRASAPFPASGRQLVDTMKLLNDETDLAPLGPRTGPLSDGSVQRAFAAGEPHDRLADPAVVRSGGFLELIRESSYPDAVCWIIARLADGLAHAHAHGVLHNDLKPANVLLTDEGQPMLLDFGVAEDWKVRTSGPAASIGGTLPYMSPEHLQSVRDRQPATDPRSDVYALGLLLHEMLTGQYPFRFPTGKLEEELPRMIAERKAAPPRIRHLNPTVSPGLEAIARKCLEADPAKRFQQAGDLRDELDRHRAGLPLVHTAVPVRERLRKWAGRHPRLSSSLTLGSVAAVVIALCGVGLYSRDVRLTRYEAEEVSRALSGEVRTAHYMLSTRTPEQHSVDAGITHARAALDKYGLPADAAWESRPQFKALTGEEQATVRWQLLEASMLLARGYSHQSKDGRDRAKLDEAVQMNALAERLAGDAPRAVLEQRSELLRLAGKKEEAEKAADRAKAAPVLTARDYYLSGTEAVAAGKYREAIRLLTQAAERDPSHFWTHMSLGVAYESMALPNEAMGHYTTAIALWPDSEWAYYSRGLAALRCWDFHRAKADLDKVIALNPENEDAYLNRALVLQGLRQFDKAIADLDKALALGAPEVRVVLMRARVRDLAGDKDAANKDLAEGLKVEPKDELDWVTRGTARLNTDPAGAVKDFDAALELNTRSLAAHQNKASALSKLGKHADAIATLDQLLEMYPDFVSARIARGVQHAREGHAKEAIADSEEALRRDAGPATQYQAANIYAHLSRTTPEYRAVAINHLTAALRGGFGYEYVETDKDMDPIRATPEFKRILDSVRVLKAIVR